MSSGTCNWVEHVAPYSLGELGAGEEAFERHLKACAICQEELAGIEAALQALALSVPEVDPPAHLWQRLEQRIQGEPRSPHATGSPVSAEPWQLWAADPAVSPVLVHADQGAFEATSIEGIQARKLFVDAANDRVTMLVRMRAGTAFPGHRHASAEECYVLSGDLRFDEHVMRAGDYQFCPAESSHSIQSTEEGCLLLLVSSQHDERA
jgi:anti-sigma factor ChrR (cupin superfamily)